MVIPSTQYTAGGPLCGGASKGVRGHLGLPAQVLVLRPGRAGLARNLPGGAAVSGHGFLCGLPSEATSRAQRGRPAGPRGPDPAFFDRGRAGGGPGRFRAALFIGKKTPAGQRTQKPPPDLPPLGCLRAKLGARGQLAGNRKSSSRPKPWASGGGAGRLQFRPFPRSIPQWASGRQGLRPRVGNRIPLRRMVETAPHALSGCGARSSKRGAAESPTALGPGWSLCQESFGPSSSWLVGQNRTHACKKPGR